eukprot:TRINITY_DN846_c0_g1_i17.p1 TRINITY_DN846_c0_g1~~TRINITY_DN846_c0_g1_i17.p1  ORF type:complete len:277 (-),score=85.85 TRINITY_DN846_c0_g1_i17:460-1290(-)
MQHVLDAQEQQLVANTMTAGALVVAVDNLFEQHIMNVWKPHVLKTIRLKQDEANANEAALGTPCSLSQLLDLVQKSLNREKFETLAGEQALLLQQDPSKKADLKDRAEEVCAQAQTYASLKPYCAEISAAVDRCFSDVPPLRTARFENLRQALHTTFERHYGLLATKHTAATGDNLCLTLGDIVRSLQCSVYIDPRESADQSLLAQKVRRTVHRFFLYEVAYPALDLALTTNRGGNTAHLTAESAIYSERRRRVHDTIDTLRRAHVEMTTLASNKQ